MASSIVVTVYNDKNERQNLRNTIKTTRYLLKLILKERDGKIYIFLTVLMSLINVIPTIVYTLMPGLILNELIGSRQINRLVLYVGTLVLIPVVNQVVKRFVRGKMSCINLKISAKLLQMYNYHTAMMDYQTIEQPNIQILSNRVSGTVSNALGVVDRLRTLLSAIISLIAITSIIVTINLYIILMVIAIIFVNSIITQRLNKKTYLNNKEISKFDRYLNSLLIVLHYQSYAKEVRLFHLKSYFADMLYKKRTEANRIHLKNTTNSLNAKILFAIMNLIQQVALYIYLIYKVIYTGLTIGSMSIYLAAVGQFVGSLNGVVNGYLEMSKKSLDIQEMIAFLDIPLKQYQLGHKKPIYDSNSVIEFRNVSFIYPGSERYALQNMNITLHGNEKLCIVGENGSGKSTFIKLLTRLYLPTDGEILLNGININEYDYEQYQRLFAPVFQDYQLYSLSILENIVLADKFDEERLEDICSQCNLTSLISKLPRGYDTPIYKILEENGFEPSGGEGQCIAIARALYHDAPIFLLDEPTASLDPSSEHEIYLKLNKIIASRSAIFITHRLSAVQLADKVAVFDNGQVVEYGTHHELYSQKGLYTEMFDKQAQFYREESKNGGQLMAENHFDINTKHI